MCVQDWERLHAAFWDIHAYKNMLERKRKQLENAANEQVSAQTTITLPQSIEHIELDLRDLMRHVRSQVHTYSDSVLSHVLSPFEGSGVNTFFVLLSSPDEAREQLWDEADHADRTDICQPPAQIPDDVG